MVARDVRWRVVVDREKVGDGEDQRGRANGKKGRRKANRVDHYPTGTKHHNGSQAGEAEGHRVGFRSVRRRKQVGQLCRDGRLAGKGSEDEVSGRLVGDSCK